MWPLCMDIMVPRFYIFPFVFPSSLFCYCFFFFFLKKILLLFLYVLTVFSEGKHSGNRHISTCTISSLTYLLLNDILSEGGSVDDSGGHFLLRFLPVNLPWSLPGSSWRPVQVRCNEFV